MVVVVPGFSAAAPNEQSGHPSDDPRALKPPRPPRRTAPVPRLAIDSRTIGLWTPKTHLLVSNLDPFTTTNQIKLALAEFGKLQLCELALDPYTGAPVGMCRIRFADPVTSALAAAKRLMAASVAINGQPITVQADESGALLSQALARRAAEREAAAARASSAARHAAAEAREREDLEQIKRGLENTKPCSRAPQIILALRLPSTNQIILTHKLNKHLKDFHFQMHTQHMHAFFVFRTSHEAQKCFYKLKGMRVHNSLVHARLELPPDPTPAPAPARPRPQAILDGWRTALKNLAAKEVAKVISAVCNGQSSLNGNALSNGHTKPAALPPPPAVEQVTPSSIWELRMKKRGTGSLRESMAKRRKTKPTRLSSVDYSSESESERENDENGHQNADPESRYNSSDVEMPDVSGSDTPDTSASAPDDVPARPEKTRGRLSKAGSRSASPPAPESKPPMAKAVFEPLPEIPPEPVLDAEGRVVAVKANYPASLAPLGPPPVYLSTLQDLVRDEEDFTALQKVAEALAGELTQPSSAPNVYFDGQLDTPLQTQEHQDAHLFAGFYKAREQRHRAQTEPVGRTPGSLLQPAWKKNKPAWRFRGYQPQEYARKGEYLLHKQNHSGPIYTLQFDEATKTNDQCSVIKETKQMARMARSTNYRREGRSMGFRGQNRLFEQNKFLTRSSAVKFARSVIHNWGLYAREPISKGDLIIEYVGERIRAPLADLRERNYIRAGIGSSYLFRVDKDVVIDATRRGGVARFINHSCAPNCFAKIDPGPDKLKHILIRAARDIALDEELTYDYRFAREEDDQRIPCLCGATTCRGYLN